MKAALIILVSVLGHQSGWCQKRDSTGVSGREFFNNVFVEGGGGSIFYSVGYERIVSLSKKRAQHHLSMGSEFSYLSINARTPNDMNVNFTIGYLYGQAHQLDTELGLIWRINLNPYPDRISEQIDRKIMGLPHRLAFSSVYSIGIGYRYDGLRRLGFRIKPMYVFKYDFDLKYLSLSFPYFDTAVYFKF